MPRAYSVRHKSQILFLLTGLSEKQIHGFAARDTADFAQRVIGVGSCKLTFLLIEHGFTQKVNLQGPTPLISPLIYR